MRQPTFAGESFEIHRKLTRREIFLNEMDQIVPWATIIQAVEPFYPKPAGAGRRPIGLDRMLRIHFLQHWFNLSDPGVEEALLDSRALRRFAGIDLGREPVPDETTICKFRHLLEKHELGDRLLEVINKHLEASGLRVGTGTIVDATIIHAPSSTKNREKQRDPDMHQTKKGNQWYFGMKGHIGVDSRHKLIHSAAVTAANVHDSQLLSDLLHGKETRVWGDSAYTGQREVILKSAPYAQDFCNRKGRRNHPLTDEERGKNRTKSKVRAKVEHPFLILKRIFGFTKVRYRGLEKNGTRFFVACGLANLYMARGKLLRAS
ncbi:MAG: IS5 family transposase [Planctomycetes bacterium]|nr:IS5 family transposase [Planctomycetota bacterium]